MKQPTFSSAGFDRYAKTTKRDVFLSEMDAVVPWPLLCGLIAPHYPGSGQGRPPVGLERMPRSSTRRVRRRMKPRRVTWTCNQARNRRKSRVRSRIEHVIGVLKRVFGFSKVRYRGLDKNANRLFATGGPINLYNLRKRLRTA